MTTKDRLEIFLELIEVEENNYNKKYDKIKDILCSISHKKDAFLYLYENLKEDQRPDWKNEESSYFRGHFFDVIKKLDDEKFNDYFFQGFESLIDIEIIRQEGIKRQNNDKLQNFIKEIDKPKSIDKIINQLATFYNKDDKRFEELVLENKDQLKKLNNITSTKSRALESLYYLLNYEYKQKDFLHAIYLSEKLGFDLVARRNYFNEFRMNEYNRKINIEDIKGLELLFDKNPTVPQYEILLGLTNLSNPIEVIESIKENKEMVVYLWDIYDKYIHSWKSKNSLLERVINNFKSNYGYEAQSSFDILKAVLADKSAKESVKIYKYYYGEIENEVNKDVKNLEELIMEAKLIVWDNKLEKKDNVIKKSKI